MTRHRPSPRRRMHRLRNLMIHATDLSHPMSYFLDHLASDQEFLQQSVPGNPDLDGVLHAVGRHLLGLEGALGTRRFFRNGELWHGRCSFGARALTVLYHGGIEIGLVAAPLDGQHATVRFTRVPCAYLPCIEQPAN